MNITNKQEMRAFVEHAISRYTQSTGYSIISVCSGDSQEFINGKLYNLYKEAERSSSSGTLRLLKEVLDEYPGFPSYYREQTRFKYAEEDRSDWDLPWCEHVINPAARRFWGLDSGGC